MDLKMFGTVLGTVFLAELGDKTQIATLLFASRAQGSLVTVFFAASLALILASAAGVAAGGLIASYVDAKVLSYVAGVGFIAVGAWTIWAAYAT